MKSKKEKNHKVLYGILLILLGLTICINFFIFGYNLSQGNYHFQSSENEIPITQVTFGTNFTQEERDWVTNTINSMKPEYQFFLRDVYFSKSREFIDENCDGEITEGNETRHYWGCNVGYVSSQGLGDKVYILYTSNEKQMKVTLCHELLHSIVVKPDYSHPIVYDLADMGVCYK